MKLGSAVHAVWVDSTAENRWTDVDGLIPELDVCQSIGWLVRDTSDFITVAGHKSNATGCYDGLITIPRVAIKSLKRITP